MQKIKILDPQEAIKIAAGEVVERPAHILKELIENSIDAGATHITIHSKKSGKELLSITDDGSGMSPADARLCFLHHATSKIISVNDLEGISTYGFRGEALSSIASVARVQLTTKTDDDKGATEIIMESGKVQQEQTVAHPTGTTIVVTKLFDQIPARKKFLKSDDTEWNAIIAIFQAFCLRYTHINFKIFHDDKLSYNCPATTNIIQRCAQLWSNDLHDQLIPIDPVVKSKITISGATTKSHYHRYNRNQIFTFVNNRWVKNIELSRAIMKGYQNVLPHQKYPATFISLEIDPTLIDINIHPKKEEVKFLHPGIVQTAIQEVITEALNSSISSTKNISFDYKNTTLQQKHIQNFADITQAYHLPNEHTPYSQNETKILFTPKATQHFEHIESSKEQPGVIDQSTATHMAEKTSSLSQQAMKSLFSSPFQEDETIKNVQTTNQTIYEEEPYSIIGQFNNTYIMIEQNNQLLIIDQHAAHERILYEHLKKHFTEVATVQLLFPHIVKLSTQDVTLLDEHISLFEAHGIVLERFSDTEIIIQATPVSLQHKAITEIIQTTITWIKEHQHIDPKDFFKELNESIHTQKACKTAFKAGDILNVEQMHNIVQTLFKIENRFCCPHGRPTIWNLELKEIEKYFKRDYKSIAKPIFL